MEKININIKKLKRHNTVKLLLNMQGKKNRNPTEGENAVRMASVWVFRSEDC